MAAGELEFIIKARDELTQTLNQLQASVGAFGEKTEQEFKKAAKGGDSFTAWMRGERQDQRTTNFLFRQMNEVVGAAALGLTLFSNTAGGASGKTKQLSDGLNQGFVAFQGISFALGQINPMLGLVAGGVAGLSVLFKNLSGDIPKTQEEISRADAAMRRFLSGKGKEDLRREINDTIVQIRKYGAEIEAIQLSPEGPAKKSVYKGEIIEGERELTEEQVRQIANLRENQEGFNLKLRVAQDLLDNNNKKIKEGVNPLLSQVVAYESIIAKTEAQNKMIAAAFPLTTAHNQTLFDRIQLLVTLGEKEYSRLTDAERALRIEQERANLKKKELPSVQVSTLKEPESIRKGFDIEVVNNLEQGFESLGVTASNTAGLITSSMQSAAASIVDVMFGATQSIEQFFVQMIKRIATMLIEEQLKSFSLGFIGKVLGIPIAGAPGVSGGVTAPRAIPPEIVAPGGGFSGAARTVNINVNGRKLYASPTERNLTMKEIGDAIFTEKFAI